MCPSVNTHSFVFLFYLHVLSEYQVRACNCSPDFGAIAGEVETHFFLLCHINPALSACQKWKSCRKAANLSILKKYVFWAPVFLSCCCEKNSADRLQLSTQRSFDSVAPAFSLMAAQNLNRQMGRCSMLLSMCIALLFLWGVTLLEGQWVLPASTWF